MSRRYDYDDPGWPLATILRALIPFWGRMIVRRPPQTNGLKAIRSLFVSLFISPLLLLLVLSFLDDGQREGASLPVLVAVAATGVVFFALAEWGGQRRFVDTTPASVLNSYRAIFFFRFATAEVPTLAGFVLFFFTGQGLIVYALGMCFTLGAFLRMAPTKASIRRYQRRIRGINLGELLTSTSGPR